MAKILFVEDELKANHFLIDALREAKHEVDIAETRKDAKEKLEKKQYDLIVLDIMLPDEKDTIPLIKRGIYLLKEIRRGDFPHIPQNIPIIIISAVPENQIENQIKEEIEILGKPFTAEKFIEKVANLLEERDG